MFGVLVFLLVCIILWQFSIIFLPLVPIFLGVVALAAVTTMLENWAERRRH